jgi:chromate transport protein ChrA
MSRQEGRDEIARLTRGELFSIFFKAGLAFGGGLGILAVLEDELVSKRSAATRDEFLTI